MEVLRRNSTSAPSDPNSMNSARRGAPARSPYPVARIDDAASADLDSLTAFLTARQNVGSGARRVLVKGNGVEAFSRLATHAPITPKVLEEGRSAAGITSACA